MTERGGIRRGAAPFVEIEVDADLRVTQWSPRAAQAFGVAAEAAVGEAIAALIPVAGGEDAWRSVLVEADAGQVWPLARDGEERVFEWLHTCLFAADGAVCGAALHGREVTDRVAAERQGALDHKILRALLETLPMVLWAIDADGIFKIQDGRAAMVPPGTMVGQSIFSLYGDAAELRRAVAGEANHAISSEFGKVWESWMVPIVAERAGDVAVVGISLDVTESMTRERELRDKLELIERQQQVIRAMGTPIIEVWDRVLCLPILGLVDSVRTSEIMDSVLQAIVRVRARFAILDMTGVEVVDTSTAGHLIGLVRAIELLGAKGIITGIHPNIAQTMVALGMDLSRITVHSNLREGLKHCIVRMAGR